MIGSNFDEQAQVLPTYNGGLGEQFKQADCATRIRQISKLAMAGHLMISAAKWYDGVDPTLSLTFTAICGGVWLVSNMWAKKIEPIAQAALVDLKGR
ncbi:MAG: hypothetical protein H0V82_00480 [Candidatus Protochlamydia sp.]|nr:hypothetical protein [Candidatus Protochlamydia sp.]